MWYADNRYMRYRIPTEPSGAPMMFVSYSRDESELTRELVKNLSLEGIECWFDESNIPVGQAFVEHLGRGLREVDCYLLVDTPASRASYWVTRELQAAFRYRRDGKYHSVFRLYTTKNRYIDTSGWDESLLLDSNAPVQIAKFIADRRIGQPTPDFCDERENVTFLNRSGLGQPKNWSGRQDKLRELDEWWRGYFPAAWLYGSGGGGKSGLLQTWITALSCLGYGEPVSVSVMYLRGSEIDVIEARHTLNTWEMNNATPPQLLLVVDGHDEARNTQEVDDFLAHAIRIGARTVVTSRTSIPPQLSRDFTDIQIGNMTRRDSAAMLNEFGVSGPEHVELAEELGYHPLALLLFSNSLVNGNKSAVDLLEDLRNMRRDMPVGESCTAQLIQTTLRNCLQSLTSDARTLLETLCQSIEDAPNLPELQNPAIRVLEKNGLIQIDNFGEQKRISIHPLVRGYINEEQSEIIALADDTNV